MVFEGEVQIVAWGQTIQPQGGGKLTPLLTCGSVPLMNVEGIY